VMQQVSSLLEDMDLPDGVLVEFGGQDQLMTEAFQQLALTLVLGIVLVFMVMAAQFESLLQPFAIMFTLPLAFIGVAGGLWIGNLSLNVPGLIGIILLAGIVVNNGIVLIDYVNVLRSRGMPRNAAIAEAGRVRLRPILMTSLTTILGMLPLALATGEGSEMQKPIAMAVIGGLTVATVLTLVVIPVVYSILDGIKVRFRRLFGSAKSRDEGIGAGA
ncbi:MAG: efflux RND transporter permease subunit, partial [Firmicutes bacterium]|nr:efflux RND transporter permease subunit [Bacillota bacterium]